MDLVTSINRSTLLTVHESLPGWKTAQLKTGTFSGIADTTSNVLAVGLYLLTISRNIFRSKGNPRTVALLNASISGVTRLILFMKPKNSFGIVSGCIYNGDNIKKKNTPRSDFGLFLLYKSKTRQLHSLRTRRALGPMQWQRERHLHAGTKTVHGIFLHCKLPASN